MDRTGRWTTRPAITVGSGTLLLFQLLLFFSVARVESRRGLFVGGYPAFFAREFLRFRIPEKKLRRALPGTREDKPAVLVSACDIGSSQEDHA